VPYPTEDGTCLSQTRVAPKPLWGGRIESVFSQVAWSVGPAGSTSGSSTVASGSRRGTAVASPRHVIGADSPTRMMTKKKKDRLQRLMNCLPVRKARTVLCQLSDPLQKGCLLASIILYGHRGGSSVNGQEVNPPGAHSHGPNGPRACRGPGVRRPLADGRGATWIRSSSRSSRRRP
jgi:hypothetical protein